MLEIIAPLDLKAYKIGIVNKESRIYLFSQFHNSMMLLLTFSCLYRLATFAVNRLNRAEEGCKMVSGFITLLLQDKVL